MSLEKAVEDFQWDPLSAGYALAAVKDGGLQLLDLERYVVVRTFDRQTQGISSVVWLPKQPGNFVTSSSRVRSPHPNSFADGKKQEKEFENFFFCLICELYELSGSSL